MNPKFYCSHAASKKVDQSKLTCLNIKALFNNTNTVINVTKLNPESEYRYNYYFDKYYVENVR